MFKKILFPLVIVAIAVACNESVKGDNGVVFKSAVQYNDFIVSRQTTLIKNVLEFSKVAENSIDSAEARLRQYVKQAETMIDEIKGMPPYKGDTALRNAAIQSFSFYKKVFEKDYMDILQIKKKGAEVTEEDINTANAIVQKISEEEEEYDKKFHEAQKNYAEKNNMKLTDNKMQKEIDKINQN